MYTDYGQRVARVPVTRLATSVGTIHAITVCTAHLSDTYQHGSATARLVTVPV